VLLLFQTNNGGCREWPVCRHYIQEGSRWVQAALSWKQVSSITHCLIDLAYFAS